jgi:O-antigen/teichoic acid export membrane protein
MRAARSPALRATRQTLFANVVMAAISVATGALAAHLLGPPGRGELAAIQLLPSVFAVLAMVGMHEALAFSCAKERGRANVYLPTAIALAVAASLLFVAIGYVALPSFLRSSSSDVIEHSRRYLILVPLYALVMLPSHALRGTSQFGWWNILRVAPSIAWLAVLLLAMAARTTTAGALADGNLVATAALGILVFVVLRRSVRGPYRFEHAAARSLLRYGLPAAGAALPQMLNLRLDQLIMAGALSPRVLGLYVVAVSWSSAVYPVLFAIGMVLLPRVAGTGEEAARHQVLARAVRVGAWAAIGTVCVVALITPIAFRVLFPSSFAEAIPAAVVLVAAAGLYGFNFILAEGVRGLGQPKVTLYSELVGLAVTGLALAAFLNWLGIMGAAVSAAAGYSAVTTALLYHLRREVPTLGGTVLTRAALSEAATAMVHLVKHRSID